MTDHLLSVRGLVTAFPAHGRMVPAVDGIDFDLSRGEFLGIVGESGSGKSVTALSIMRLIQHPGRIVAGKVAFAGTDLLTLDERAMRRIRGKRISMIFQEPMTSLNPVFTVGEQIGEALRLHEGMSRKEARNRTIEVFECVGIPSPEQRVDSYPHEMSGGMRQRAMIAMALACNPDLLIADEPTTALDVTIQAQILDLLRRLRDDFGLTMIFITHDLGVIAELVDRVIVMYGGKPVEVATTDNLFHDPRHPYTQGLLNSIPRVEGEMDRLTVITGTVPNLLEMPEGCRFHPRCPHVTDECWHAVPAMVLHDNGSQAACFHQWGKEDGS